MQSLFCALPDQVLIAERVVDESIENGVELTDDTFTEALDLYSIGGSALALFRNHATWSTIRESIVDEEASILDVLWELIGIDIQLDNTGNIQAILIVNQP